MPKGISSLIICNQAYTRNADFVSYIFDFNYRLYRIFQQYKRKRRIRTTSRIRLFFLSDGEKGIIVPF
jgi:hypothetical protein